MKSFIHSLRKTVPAFGILLFTLFASCQKEARLPENFTEITAKAVLFPDYQDVTIPPNIAPLNFMITDSSATEYVVHFQSKAPSSGQLLAGGGEDGKIMIDSTQWRNLLSASKGQKIAVSVYGNRPSGWVKFKDYNLHVAEEPIDPYLSYRLIEPGYELYRQLGLYQRNLTNWDVHTIYENNRTYEEKNNHCINCHNYKNYSTQDMLFHVRANHGGTIVIQNGKAKKVQIKDSTIITAGVYPSWHPTKDLVAFSTNKTGQTFHLYHPEKIEVMDEASDLLLYNPGKNEVKHILRTRNDMETFPNWSPDGKTLYYCNCELDKVLDLETMPDSMIAREIALRYNLIKYSLKKVDFDPQTQTFGEPQMVVDAPAKGKSITLPRVSPDGRYVLYTEGDYGQFHIWHKSSDLWVKDLQADTCYALKPANSKDVDSYHTWSSNGRWIVFSSRRDDGNYTRPYIAYFDKNGKARKAFMLPHEDPEYTLLLLRSYNVPELTTDAVTIPASELRECIYGGDGEKAKYTK